MHWTAQKQPNIYVIVGSLISYGRENQIKELASLVPLPISQ
jgi:hypothetical protein